MSIVIPLPSGVTIAEKIKKTKIAYRQLLFQKSFLTIPGQLNNTIKTGKRNIIPLTNISPKIKKINSLITKNGVTPIIIGKP